VIDHCRGDDSAVETPHMPTRVDSPYVVVVVVVAVVVGVDVDEEHGDEDEHGRDAHEHVDEHWTCSTPSMWSLTNELHEICVQHQTTECGVRWTTSHCS